MRIRHGTYDLETYEERRGAWVNALRLLVGFTRADEIASGLAVFGLNLAAAGALHAAHWASWAWARDLYAWEPNADGRRSPAIWSLEERRANLLRRKP